MTRYIANHISANDFGDNYSFFKVEICRKLAKVVAKIIYHLIYTTSTIKGGKVFM